MKYLYFTAYAVIWLSACVLLTESTEYIGYLLNRGCWLDHEEPKDLSGAFHDFGDEMIPDKCFSFCSKLGFKFAGLENQQYCYCDNGYGDLTELSSGNCSCSCKGDPEKHCGCEMKLRIYELDHVEHHTKKYHGHIKHMGCYADKADYRDLDGPSKLFQTMVPDNCFEYCNSKGYKYAGLQEGKYCFCDDNYGLYGEVDNEECNCPCQGNPYKVCGCKLRNRVWELKKLQSYKIPKSRRYIGCGCWGDPHCYTFDKMPYDFMGACTYDMVSLDCHGVDLDEDLVPFQIRQGQEMREGFPGGSFVEFLELEVFGTVYRFLKDTETHKKIFTVDDFPGIVPYYDMKAGIKIHATIAYLKLEADFGLKILWNGENTRSQVFINEVYHGYTCGLCGNSDRIRTYENEFADREGNPVDVTNGTAWVRYHNWGTKWKSAIQHGEVDQDNTWCNATYTPPECSDEYKYSTSHEYCGILHDLSYDGPWKNCIFNMDTFIVDGFVSGCTMDMCMTQNNATEQKKYLCGVYADFDESCKETHAEWHVNWRNITGCNIECPPNKVYDVRNECPKTCADPLGVDCDHTVWTDGCYCEDGLVMDTDGKCIHFDECGCTVPGQDSILPVGDVIITEHCSIKYKCLTQKSPAAVYNLTKCSENAYCLDVDDEPVCVCKEGFTGDGFTCDPIRLSCEADYCFGNGDPHYRSQHGEKFEVNNTCSYILATDSLAFKDPTFSIVVDQENRYNNDQFYIKSIRIEFFDDEFVLEKNLWVNDVKTPMPYVGSTYKIYREGIYIVFDDPRFNVAFDGHNFLKVRVCEPVHYGLCSLQKGSSVEYPFKKYLAEDSACEF